MKSTDLALGYWLQVASCKEQGARIVCVLRVCVLRVAFAFAFSVFPFPFPFPFSLVVCSLQFAVACCVK